MSDNSQKDSSNDSEHSSPKQRSAKKVWGISLAEQHRPKPQSISSAKEQYIRNLIKTTIKLENKKIKKKFRKMLKLIVQVLKQSLN